MGRPFFLVSGGFFYDVFRVMSCNNPEENMDYSYYITTSNCVYTETNNTALHAYQLVYSSMHEMI